MNKVLISLLFSSAVILNSLGQSKVNPDLTKQKTLYLVANAHLDTQWNWTVQTTINNFLYNTLKDNFSRIEKYPDYVFNFEGAIKYMWMKEYYPAEYEKLKGYIAKGRWKIAGSSLEASDVNIPSSESQFRNFLLGEDFYKSEFNTKSLDVFLPDCFGFGYTLPTIAVHCGLKGFSTQKLTWGSAYGIPFDLGVWQGVDGSRIFAAFNAGDYTFGFNSGITTDSVQLDKINRMGKKTGLYVGYRYYGVGDRGGAPDENSVNSIAGTIRDTTNLKVIMASSDLLGSRLTEKQLNDMPVYNGELPLTMHGTGCYTSQAFMKFINRKNELLADAAERTSVAADWLQGAVYPREKLNEAWVRFLWHQFHDDITGTSIPETYPFSWNDELISHQQFESVFANGAGNVIQSMDTRTKGIPLVVNNALSIVRNEPVEAVVTLSGKATSIRVFNKAGKEVLSQLVKKEGDTYAVVFLATVPANGFEVYTLMPSNEPCRLGSPLTINKQVLENRKYKVSVDKNGDISGIYDKLEKKELLASPSRLEMLNDETPQKPAWRIYYNAITAKPRTYVGNVKSVEIVEAGPVRVSLKITRETDGSVFTQQIRLSAGDAEQRVDLVNDVDWNSRNTLLKASFPFMVSDSIATYNLAIGTIKRRNNTSKLYEVSAHQWADITDKNGSYGVSILNDSKYGWDKPADNTLRLTLLHSPMTKGLSYYQTYQDLGKHHFTYSFSGHSGSWKNCSALWQPACLNQPLIAFQTNAHNGDLGKSFSMASVNTNQVAIKALKKTESGNAIVIRLQEMTGEKADNVSVGFASSIISAKELNGIEEEIGNATVKNGKLQLDMKSYQPRTFAVILAKANMMGDKIQNQPIELKYNAKVTTSDHDRTIGDFDNLGHSLPAELLPAEINSEGVVFKLKKENNEGKIEKIRRTENSALIPRGDTIQLPKGNFNRIYVLAAATEDTNGTFIVDGKAVTLGIQYYSGFIGQWNTLTFDRPMNEELPMNEVTLVKQTPAYLKQDNIAWVGTHRHSIVGINEAYKFCYLYKYAIDIPQGAKTLVLPNNDKIRIMAITVSNDPTKGTMLVSPVEIKL